LVCLETAHKQWAAANAIGPTVTTWEVTEAEIRKRYAELEAMTRENRDVAILKASSAQKEMLGKVLDHVNGMIGKRKLADMEQKLKLEEEGRKMAEATQKRRGPQGNRASRRKAAKGKGQKK